MICRQCGTEASPGERFCRGCGALLAARRSSGRTGAIVAACLAGMGLIVALGLFVGVVGARWMAARRATPAASTGAYRVARIPPSQSAATPPSYASREEPEVESSVESLPQDDSLVFPDSSTREIPEAELAALDDATLCLARNEIFARHGMEFRSPPLRDHFAKLSWYRPTTANQADVSAKFSAVEATNVAHIKALEESRDSKYLKGVFYAW